MRTCLREIGWSNYVGHILIFSANIQVFKNISVIILYQHSLKQKLFVAAYQSLLVVHSPLNRRYILTNIKITKTFFLIIVHQTGYDTMHTYIVVHA